MAHNKMNTSPSPKAQAAYVVYPPDRVPEASIITH